MTSTAFRDRNRTANTKNYREWLEDHRILVEMTEAEGFTRDQAVEMVKAYYLYSIESNMGKRGPVRCANTLQGKL